MKLKRGFLALAAMILGVGFLGASPAFALATPPAPPAGCTQVTAGTAVWPKGAHSYYCGSASAANGALMQAPLNTASNMGKSFTEMKNLAGGAVAWNRGNFYLFKNVTEYTAALPGWPIPSAGSPGFTASDNSPGYLVPLFTVIFEEIAPGVPNKFIGNVSAHELGHWMDSLENAVLTGNEVIRLNGTVTVGHTISLTVTAGDISGGSATVSAVSVAGDTLNTMATKLAAAAMAEPKLTSKGYATAASGSSVTITYTGTGGPTYSYSITGAGAITEQVWLDSGPKASSHALIIHSIHGNPANTNGDVFTFNGLDTCRINMGGVFNQQMDENERYICATATNASMAGVVTPGHNLTLNINDPEVNGGANVPVVVPVVAGDTISTLVTKFKNAINSNGILSAKFITATSTATTIRISSGTGNNTTYSFSNGGGTETMTFTGLGSGKDNILSRLHFPVVNSNWGTVNLAWPGPGSNFSDDDETFAETFAAQIGGYTDRTFPGTSTINYQSNDWYLQQSPGFRCLWYVIRNSGQSRVKPTAGFPSGCPTS